MAGGRVLSADVIMAQLGVYDLAGTKEVRVPLLPRKYDLLVGRRGSYNPAFVGGLQLILRDEELEALDDGCARALTAIEVLSLSHNKLVSLEHFEHFTNLVEVRREIRDAQVRGD